jgi:hypothetical protein
MPPAKDAEYRNIDLGEIEQYIEDFGRNTTPMSGVTSTSAEVVEFLNEYSFAYAEGYVFTTDEDVIYNISIKNIYITFDVEPQDMDIRKLRTITHGIHDFLKLCKGAEFIDSEMMTTSLKLKGHFD